MEALWEKLLFWKKKPKTPKLGVDYELYNFPDSLLTGVRLLKGEYCGVTYYYGKTGIKYEGVVAVLKFDYQIIDSGKLDPRLLQSDENFVTILGDILTEIIINESVNNEQTRNFDSEEFDLQ